MGLPMSFESTSTKDKDIKLPTDFCMDLCIPLKKPIKLVPKKLETNFRRRWGTELVVRENSELSNKESGLWAYLMTNKRNFLAAFNSGAPLDSEMVDFFSVGIGVNDEDRRALGSNRGNILLRVPNMNDNPLDRAVFAVQSLLLFMSDRNALGYACRSAQFYRPRRFLDKFQKTSTIGLNELLSILIAHHHIVEKGWSHCHGMDQFDAPDIEIMYDEKEKDYYQNILLYFIVQCIENGPILKVGDTLGSSPDSKEFRIQPAIEKSDHSYGKHGGILIAKE
jgi:hypothetical protein